MAKNETSEEVDAFLDDMLRPLDPSVGGNPILKRKPKSLSDAATDIRGRMFDVLTECTYMKKKLNLVHYPRVLEDHARDRLLEIVFDKLNISRTEVQTLISDPDKLELLLQKRLSLKSL